MEELELYNMNGYFISKPLSLLVGTYTIEKFLVVDATGNILYASPLESSALAYLVNDPLPINFSVNKDEVLKLVPEVLSTENLTPEDFGYTTFSFDIVETFDFLLSVFVYNETVQNFELTDAMLSVLAEGNNIYSDTLAAITNQIKVNDGFDSYILTVKKEGYTSYVDTFTNAELKLYFRSEDNGPLEVVMQKDVTKSISFVTDQSTNKEVNIRLQGTLGKYLTINWGDNSPIENIAFSSETITLIHTYKGIEKYEIKIIGDIDAVTNINMPKANLISANITKAINLERIFISGNRLSSLDVSQNENLLAIHCGQNNIQNLELYNNSLLRSLDCSENPITELNLDKNKNLESLQSINNPINNLDLSTNLELISLFCVNNNLSYLDVSNNTKLEFFLFGGNEISDIDISRNINLTLFNCTNSKVSNIDFSHNHRLSLKIIMSILTIRCSCKD